MGFLFYTHTSFAPLLTELIAPGQRLDIIASFLYRAAAESGYEGNALHCALTEALVTDENPYTLAAERRGKVEGTLREAVLSDLEIFRKLFALDLKALGEAGGMPELALLADYRDPIASCRNYSAAIRDAINALAKKLAAARDAKALRDELEIFYRDYGVGMPGLHKAFRIDGTAEAMKIFPINSILPTDFDDLIGYESQKAELIGNTEAFLAGKRANNCLLYGEAGTGKSTSIRALLHRYYDRGLRMVEVYKHQYREINELIGRIKHRNYRFILYLDDLSFEEFEVEYKYLKAVIEGGLESRPDNVLIYATSNRRHLVKETFDDRPESPIDKHKNETIQEKLSLYARFGVSIYYGSPEQKEYFRIVDELAKRHGLNYTTEELHLLANRFELSHSGLSGRTARQFIDRLLGEQKTE